MKNFLYGILVLFIASCAFMVTPVTVVPAAKVNRVYIMAGKVEANSQTSIISKITARVTKVNGDIGKTVKKGDPLVCLDVSDVGAQVTQAKAALNYAQANLSYITKGTRPEQIAQEKAALESLRKTYELAQKNHKNLQTLYDSGAASKQDLDNADSAETTAGAQYKGEQDKLELLTKGSTSDQINAVRYQRDQAAAVLKQTEELLKNGVIMAPISGKISDKKINPGEIAATNQQLLVITSFNTPSIDAYLPVNLIGKVKYGQKVFIKISELPGKEFYGTVETINSVIGSNGSILVKVKFSDDSAMLKPGMFAEIGIMN